MVVLASQSPRRREILTSAGIPFEVRASGVDEVRLPGEEPAAYVLRLASEKAQVAVRDEREFVLAADTTVVCEGEVLEKPGGFEDACRMLTLLSGREHEVLTGVCLYHAGRHWSAVETTRVRFLPLSQLEIRAYVSTGQPMDKAGAYGIQGLASRYIDRIEGCYFNVVGLPVSRVWRLLREAGYGDPGGSGA